MTKNKEKQEKILIVDDSDFCRKIIGAALAVIGYKIESAKNGKQAVKLIKQTAQDLNLIILDLKMPELSGVDVLKLVLPAEAQPVFNKLLDRVI